MLSWARRILSAARVPPSKDFPMDEDGDAEVNSFQLFPSDYQGVSDLRWYSRRAAITLIVILYTCAVLLYLEGVLALREIPKQALHGQPNQEQVIQIPTDVTVTQVDDWLPDIMVKSKTSRLTTMVVMGFLGSVLLLMRTLVRTHRGMDLPIMWYFLHPMKGAILAVFLYVILMAGGGVFFGTPDASKVNIYTMITVAILAGVFSEQAFEMLRGYASSKIFKKG